VSGVLDKIQTLKKAIETGSFVIPETNQNKNDAKKKDEEKIDLISEIKDKFLGSEVEPDRFKDI
jgi:hypothetical protein